LNRGLAAAATPLRFQIGINTTDHKTPEKSMKIWRRRFIAIGGIVLTSVVGCGPSLVPVEGTITLDGKPLAGATVGMELIGGEKDFRLFSGETDANGRYIIKPFERDRAGALAGEYHVMITSVKAPPGANEMTVLPPEPVPPEYQNGSKTLTVPEGGTTDADFAINTR
jgi:hypothetical protein